MLKPFKFVVQAHFIDVEDGKVIGEATSEPFFLYGESLVELSEKGDQIVANGIAQLGENSGALRG